MATENKGYIEAMRDLRRSSAAQPHANQHRLAKRGLAKGGRPRRHQFTD
jgi:hypothetical protein